MQSSPGGETPDNRVLWGQVNVDSLEYVGPLILWYISVEHTSVAVEQDIGRTRSLLEKHCGPLLDNGSLSGFGIWDLLGLSVTDSRFQFGSYNFLHFLSVRFNNRSASQHCPEWPDQSR